ncbi:MAG: MFS transporter [Candidatus Omnitrophica bacterium]|nr:MFS transporter [Candidatus Omnitrophota bacterium]
MVSAYFKILFKRNFALLWFGQIISQFGDRLTQFALVGLVSKVSMTSSSLAVVMSMAVIPVFIISPISGVYTDRWSKRKTMYTSDLIRAIFILLIPLFFSRFKNLLPIYFLIFLSFSAGRFFIPAKMAFIPEVVNKDRIFMANSLVSTTAMIAAVMGIGWGAIIVEKLGITAAFVLDAITFFISSLAILFITTKEKGKFLPKDIFLIGKDVVANIKKSFLYELKEGIAYIFKSDETRYAFKIYLFLFSYIGALYVVFIRYIQLTLGSITQDLGFVAVSLGAGLFLGSIIYGRAAHKISIKTTINSAIMLSSLFLIFYVVYLKNHPFILVAIPLSVFLGILISPTFIAINALIHKESDHKLLGRIFSGLEFTSHLGFLATMFLASILADIFTPFTIIISIGIIGFFVSLIFILKNDPRT